MMNKSVAWSEIKNLKGRFIDQENTISATLTNVGYAKPFKKGKWVSRSFHRRLEPARIRKQRSTLHFG